MKQTAVEWLEDKLNNVRPTQICSIETIKEWVEQAKEMEKQQKMDAYQHGRDDENCALSDGAMAPDYDNAEEWYKGEYGGEK